MISDVEGAEHIYIYMAREGKYGPPTTGTNSLYLIAFLFNLPRLCYRALLKMPSFDFSTTGSQVVATLSERVFGKTC